MIRKQSKPKVNKETGEEEDSGTQFIVTTFKTELVKEADKCYEVFLRNKESKIRPSTKEEAARVIQEEQAIDEQVEATEE
jgi:chromosome segregation ATPase